MAYSKLAKVCQDFGLGIQQVNGAIANLESFYTAWTAEHGKEEPPLRRFLTSNPYESRGRHDQPVTPRAVVSVTLTPSAPGQWTISVGAQPTVRAVSRLATGQWFIEMDATLSTFWGIAHPVNDFSTDVRFCKPVSSLPGSSGTAPGVIVNTYDAITGSFVLTDYNFCCAIYGY